MAHERLVGKLTALRAITPEDLPFLYDLCTSDLNGFRWRFRGRIPSPREFESGLFEQVFQQFVVIDLESQTPIGLVVAHDHDASNGLCRIGVLMSEVAVGLRAGRDALDTFVSHLFRISPLRKLYAEVPGSTFDGVDHSSDEHQFRARFAVEGRLTDHWFIDGRFDDMVIVAVHRTQWEATDPS